MGVDLTVRAHFAFAKLDNKIVVALIRITRYNENSRRKQMTRTKMIKLIASLKNDAIRQGFDFPSQALDKATTAELKDFLQEIREFYLAKP
jgi:hypothetical protein